MSNIRIPIPQNPNEVIESEEGESPSVREFKHKVKSDHSFSKLVNLEVSNLAQEIKSKRNLEPSVGMDMSPDDIEEKNPFENFESLFMQVKEEAKKETLKARTPKVGSSGAVNTPTVRSSLPIIEEH